MSVQEFNLAIGDVIAERYVVTKALGSAAFSRAVAAADLQADNEPVCLKVIRSNKDFFDQVCIADVLQSCLRGIVHPDQVIMTHFTTAPYGGICAFGSTPSVHNMSTR
jgi:hypothetical protein